MGASQRLHGAFTPKRQWLGLRRSGGRLGLVRLWFRTKLVLAEVRHQHAVVTLADVLSDDWVAFIDNAAGQWALNKGYGRDPAVNGLLSAFWSLAARHSWRPTFYRVTSEANIADPILRADCALAIAWDGSRRKHPSTASWRSSPGPQTTLTTRSTGRPLT